ncbi:MAG: transcriptional regulator [Pirellulales bacterium]
MSHASPIVKSQTDELPVDIVELAQVLQSLPIESRRLVEPVFARVVESTRRRRRILNLVQDALGQLRLDMKYLLFDLDATRRERDELQQKLEDSQG